MAKAKMSLPSLSRRELVEAADEDAPVKRLHDIIAELDRRLAQEEEAWQRHRNYVADLEARLMGEPE